MSVSGWTELSGYLQGDVAYELHKSSVTTSYVDLELVAFGSKWVEFDVAFEYRPDNKTGWLEDAVITQTTANYLRGNKLFGLSASTDGSTNTIRWEYTSNSMLYGTTPQIRIRFLPRVRAFGSSNSNYTIASLYGDSLINYDGMSSHNCIGKDNSGRYMCVDSSSFYILGSLTGTALYTYAGLSNPNFAINLNNGRYVVCDYDNNRILELDSTLSSVTRTYAVNGPVFVDYCEENETLLITRDVANLIVEVSWSDMSAVTVIWQSTCSLNSPQCATYKQDDANQIVIANTNSDRVIKYNKVENTYTNLDYYLLGEDDTSTTHEISHFRRPYRVYQYRDGNICIAEKEGIPANWETLASSSSSSSIDSSSSSSSLSSESSSSVSSASSSSVSSSSVSSESSSSSTEIRSSSSSSYVENWSTSSESSSSSSSFVECYIAGYYGDSNFPWYIQEPSYFAGYYNGRTMYKTGSGFILRYDSHAGGDYRWVIWGDIGGGMVELYYYPINTACPSMTLKFRLTADDSEIGYMYQNTPPPPGP